MIFHVTPALAQLFGKNGNQCDVFAHFYPADPDCGSRIATALSVPMPEVQI